MKRAIVSALTIAAVGHLGGVSFGTIGCILGLAAVATGCIVYELESQRDTVRLKSLPEDAEQ